MKFIKPTHLDNISKITSRNNYAIFLDILCECGGDEFEVIKNDRDKEKEKEWDEWAYKREMFWKTGRKMMIYSTVPYIDKKDGKMYEYGKSYFGIRVGKYSLEEKPKFTRVVVIKAKCLKCGREYSLFDNRVHGLNSVLINNFADEKLVFSKYKHFESVTQKFKIEVEIISDYKEEKIAELIKKETNQQTFSNCFTKINIFGTPVDTSKKILIHSEETI